MFMWPRATIFVLLLSSALCMADVTPPLIEARLQAAKDRVASLEIENYAREPQLRQVEVEYKRLQESFERDHARVRGDSARFLEQEKKKRGEKNVMDTYNTLRSAWLSLSAAQAVNDPVQGPLTKAFAVGHLDFRKKLAQTIFGRPATDDELKNPDKLWETFQAAQKKTEPQVRAKIAQLEKDSGFPDVVLEFVRIGALSKVTLDG